MSVEQSLKTHVRLPSRMQATAWIDGQMSWQPQLLDHGDVVVTDVVQEHFGKLLVSHTVGEVVKPGFESISAIESGQTLLKRLFAGSEYLRKYREGHRKHLAEPSFQTNSPKIR